MLGRWYYFEIAQGTSGLGRCNSRMAVQIRAAKAVRNLSDDALSPEYIWGKSSGYEELAGCRRDNFTQNTAIWTCNLLHCIFLLPAMTLPTCDPVAISPPAGDCRSSNCYDQASVRLTTNEGRRGDVGQCAHEPKMLFSSPERSPSS